MDISRVINITNNNITRLNGERIQLINVEKKNMNNKY